MRIALMIVLVLAAATAGAAGDSFSLGLEDLPIGLQQDSTSSDAEHDSDDTLQLDVARSGGGVDREALVYWSALAPRSEQEFRLALWHSPMGKLSYERAGMEAMLGRTGLVGGGRMAGIGLANAALGDGDPGGLSLLFRGESWKSLTTGEKVEVGIQASFIAGLLYFMAQNAN